MKHALRLAALLCLPAFAASATPMWEQSDRWVCDIAQHIKAPLSGGKLRLNEENNRSVIDFVAGTRSSQFVDAVGQIVERRYYESEFGAFNFLVISWNGQDYPTMFEETRGEVWQTAASGHTSDDRTLWIATYRCLPERDVPSN